jgi:uncharacterized protein with FMN-binding domain
MEPPKSGKNKELIVALSVLILIVVIVGAIVLTSKDKSDTSDSTATTAQSENSSTKASSDTFKDGAYQATGSYSSPGGKQSITVSVTLKDGTVTDTTATGKANDAEAEEYQDQFIAHYKSQVVGKKIDTISLSRVSGSSLTSQGFNDALDQIKDQAKG